MLFTDHTCNPTNGALAPTPVNLPAAAVAKPTAYPPLGAHGPFPPTAAAANANVIAGWMANAAAASSVQAAVVTASSLPVPPNQVPILKCPITSGWLSLIDFTMIGDYLGQHKEFSLSVMHAYVDSMKFSGMKFDVAIRELLKGF